ncbi:MAG: hypothetical protein KKD77_21490, partial [Gammaproteobacteria bacterium]|nr:hypothetical protein [Gammaproteobacteria bacterium]
PASETLLIEAAPPLPPARGRTTEWVDRAVQLYTSIYIKERAPHGAVAVLDAILRNLTPQEQADYYARIDALRRRRAAARP